MKNRRVCPKCGDTDILRVEGKAGAYGSGNNIMTGMTIFSAVLVHRYVCCKCGYSEEWIDKEDIQKLKERFNGRAFTNCHGGERRGDGVLYLGELGTTSDFLHRRKWV